MNNLNQEQTIQQLNDLLGEDVTQIFEEQLKIAGEHGDPSFVVKNSKGEEIHVSVEWDKEADVLHYSIHSD
ncbi:hypothetical protein [Paucisalibacillus sp. EB02]|uniref:hypothetical protein n=1 Tax=Paucisalibacillus sp. EB02 TaxID=1347087 RepID=UPI0005A7CE55|nr:hypothetical protein [Paucisalibacillus sp. EB02]